jgi:hypothetical protein
MPTLLIRLQPTANGEIPLALPRQIRAQKMVLNKVMVVKSATNAAHTFFSIELPEIFHQCNNVGSKRGCFCVPLDKDAKLENITFSLPFGAQNLGTRLMARLYDYQGTIMTNSSHITDVFLYLSYTTDELF